MDQAGESYTAFALLLVIPLWLIFRRAGFSPLWSLLVFIPGVGTALCVMILALAAWPRGQRL